jgi:hypothetical protein
MLDVIAGPGRNRADDLFHAMEAIKPQNIDGTVLMNRHNRQKRPNGRYLRAKCGQNLNQVAKGLIVWNQPNLSSALHSVPTLGNTTYARRDHWHEGSRASGGQHGSELRSQDLSSSRIRRIKAVD